ncbi:WEB family protein At1g75720-like [Salvia miltiorrhiza]|uniref:WEB family protein At1g75720-like n=1 Tax=Salvia miltiorrhiza TaxID=226208 RepID=UPI0025AC9111|nr:WEB family protein At1g75720-like [Salvia miltiorrhiza]
MEDQVLQNSPDPDDRTGRELSRTGRSSVDSSRPFRSVKEAVAIFGERFLAGEIYSPKPFAFPKKETPFFAPSPERGDPSGAAELAESVKKLETELEETKAELKLLRDRESETEVALASLNAELHRSMSKMARAEASAAAAKAKAAAADRGPSVNLAQVLSVEEEKISVLLGGKKKEMKMKKKPIIPLVGDLFSKKKRSPAAAANLHNPLYASSHLL